jgi:hypothetical protein
MLTIAATASILLISNPFTVRMRLFGAYITEIELHFHNSKTGAIIANN